MLNDQPIQSYFVYWMLQVLEIASFLLEKLKMIPKWERRINLKADRESALNLSKVSTPNSEL